MPREGAGGGAVAFVEGAVGGGVAGPEGVEQLRVALPDLHTQCYLLITGVDRLMIPLLRPSVT